MHARPDSSPPTSAPHVSRFHRIATLWRYAAAVLVVLAAALLRHASTPWLGPEALSFAFFFPAIACTAWFGRAGPALVATALSALAARALFLAPEAALLPVDAAGWFALLLFAATAAPIIAAIELMHRASDRARAELARRLRLDEASRESEERFRALADGLPLVVWVHDATGQQQFVNRTFCEFFGVQPEEMTGERWQELVHPEDVGLYTAEFLAAVRERRSFSAEVRVRRHDGQWRWLESWARPRWSGSGEFCGFIGASADITARKRAEAETAAARDQALAASRAKDQFLAMLSHELRTPLTPALMIAAEFEQSPLVPAALHDDLATIRASIELEARLIDDLLDFARVSRGKLHLQLALCEAHAVLRRAVETVRPDFLAKPLTLEWELDPTPAPLRGDAVRLQQVFWNVLRNAVKFTAPHGTVRLRSRVADGGWRLEVKDTGVGIPPADLPRLFDSFFQTSEGAQPGLGGLGLGLAISAAIVKDHGGRIWAESEGLGCGATFIIELPLPASAPLPEPVEPVAAPRPGRALRILVVEDHEPTRSAFATLLRRRGHVVSAVEGVDAAQREAASSCFDLVISDLGLPDGDGLDLMRHLRRNHGLCGIALSGHGMDADVQNALDAGFTVHLTKPVPLRKLENALAQVMTAMPLA